MRHGGSGSAYSYHGCRCDECCRAHRNRIARRRAERLNEPIPEWVEHGTSAYTNWFCRCGVCSKAWSAYLSAKRAR